MILRLCLFSCGLISTTSKTVTLFFAKITEHHNYYPAIFIFAKLSSLQGSLALILLPHLATAKETERESFQEESRVQDTSSQP